MAKAKKLTKDEESFIKNELNFMGPGDKNGPKGTKGFVNGR